MNYERLNRMVEYIEKNLDQEIDYDELGKITHTSLFILERIFVFLTDMTLVEYIKKRRLSKAFEEIRNTDSKIIDIAIKYRYNSAAAFNRAFKNLFSMTPSECRRKKGSYKIIPMVYFKKDEYTHNLDYTIETVETFDLYCYHVVATTNPDLSYKIKELYRRIKANGQYEEFNKRGMYGVFIKKKIITTTIWVLQNMNLA